MPIILNDLAEAENVKIIICLPTGEISDWNLSEIVNPKFGKCDSKEGAVLILGNEVMNIINMFTNELK